MNWCEDHRMWCLNTFWRRWYFVMCENCFLVVFLWRWRSKDSVVLKFEGCEHRDKIYCKWRSKGCEVLIAICIKRSSKEGGLLGWGMELCGCSSCVWGLRSLLNTVGILTLPMFLCLYWVFQHKRQHFTPSWSPSTIFKSDIPMFTPSSFNTTESLDLHLQRNTTGKQFSHITKFSKSI